MINNNSKPIIATVKSRCLEINIILNEFQRVKIINDLKSIYKDDYKLCPSKHILTPGNYLIFNSLCNHYEISLENDIIENLKILLSAYKKKKDINIINLIYFVAEEYFQNLKKNQFLNNEKFFDKYNYIFESIHKFFLYNLNQTSFLNSLSYKLYNE